MSGTKGTETRLDAKQTSLGEELAGTNKKEIEERQRLHTLVQLQAQEIEALKAEISILSRKGGENIFFFLYYFYITYNHLNLFLLRSHFAANSTSNEPNSNISVNLKFLLIRFYIFPFVFFLI